MRTVVGQAGALQLGASRPSSARDDLPGIVTPRKETPITCSDKLCPLDKKQVGGSGVSVHERIVSVMRELDGKVDNLRQETDILKTQRARWAPTPPPRAAALTAGAPGDVPASVPRRCAERLAEVAAHEQRAKEAARRAAVCKKEALQCQEQREKVDRDADAAVHAADGRRDLAQGRVEEVRAQRAQAEADHRALLAAEETDGNAELVGIERAIEAVRMAADARATEAKREVAAISVTAACEADELRAEFERSRLELERSLDEYDVTCDAAVALRNGRCMDAEKAVRSAWEGYEKDSEAAHKKAQTEVEEHKRGTEQTIDATNSRLQEIEAELKASLAECTAREETARLDRSAEERVERVVGEVMQNIARRREASGEIVRQDLAEVARLTAEGASAADAAAARVRVAQENADQEVDALAVDVEKFAVGSVEGKLLELHADLQAAIAGAKSALDENRRICQAEADNQTSEAHTALLLAGQHVEELRVQANKQLEQQLEAMDAGLEDVRSEREQALAEGRAKVLKTQDQMVRYVDSQREEMLLTLGQADPAEVPLQLEFSTLRYSPGTPGAEAGQSGTLPRR